MHLRSNDPIARHCRIWLDGAEMTSVCCEADDEAGFVRVFRLIDGNPYVVGASGGPVRPGEERLDPPPPVAQYGEVATEMRFGRVEIRIAGGYTSPTSLLRAIRVVDTNPVYEDGR